MDSEYVDSEPSLQLRELHCIPGGYFFFFFFFFGGWGGVSKEHECTPFVRYNAVFRP